jgi:hypothetical protein
VSTGDDLEYCGGSWAGAMYCRSESLCSQPLDLADERLKLILQIQFKTATLYNGIDSVVELEKKS